MQSDYNPYVLHRLLVTQLTERHVFGKRARGCENCGVITPDVSLGGGHPIPHLGLIPLGNPLPWRRTRYFIVNF